MSGAIYTPTPTPSQRLAAARHESLKMRIEDLASRRLSANMAPRTEVTAAPPSPPMTDPPQPAERASPLHPSMTFASFLRGTSNELVITAAMEAANSPGKFNPLVLYGPTGLGKTHLLQAIAAAADENAIYLTGDWFGANQLGRLELSGLRRRIVLIDDVHRILGKPAQRDLLDLIDTFQRRGHQLVVSSDQAICESRLDSTIVSRLSAGLVIELRRPDRELRYALVQHRFAARGVTMPEDYLHYMADRISGNARDIDGIVNRLALGTQVSGIPIDMDAIEAVLIRMAKPSANPTVVQIQKVVARRYNVRHADILSARRTANIVQPRQVAMYLAKQMTLKSLPEIGRRFGGRDHTTVLHAVRKIEALASRDSVFAEEIEALKRAIQCEALP